MSTTARAAVRMRPAPRATTSRACRRKGSGPRLFLPPEQDKKATHKLVLQDVKGQKIYAVELRRVDKIGVGKLNIGEKILLRASSMVARGVVLLEPATCVVMGGKVDAWHKAWVDGRLARLKEASSVSPGQD
jgi:RecQ-mediated genome instability protein 1